MNTSRLNGYLRVSFGLWMLSITSGTIAQNSMVGDGFGGRLWYRPTNYGVGAYSAFSVCYDDPCDSATAQLYGWGYDQHGELGNGPDTIPSDVPMAIPSMNDVRYYSTGYMSGGIKNDATGWVWSHTTYPFPTQVLTNARFVDASIGFASFVKNDGSVWSIGDNSTGAFGDGSTTSVFTEPVRMTGVNNAVRVACGGVTNYVLLDDGTVRSVGYNGGVFLGDPAITAAYTTNAGPVSGLSQIIDIKANIWAAAALDANGDVYCWGTGGYTGDGDLLNDTIAVRIGSLSNVVAISGCTDGHHFLALDADKNCYSWGFLNYGAGGVDPAPVLVATDVIDIMAGEFFSYIVKSDGSLWASGRSRSAGASIWLGLPSVDGNGEPIFRYAFTPMDPSLVPSACPVVGSVALPDLECNANSGTIRVRHFGGQAPYQYSIGNGQQSNSEFTGLAPGEYIVTITDANGCTTTIPCSLRPFEGALVVASIDAQSTAVMPGEAVLLTGSGGTHFSWAPGTTLSCTACASPTATPLATTTYCVEVSDECSSDTACATIRVLAPEPFPCTAQRIFVPNAFSPNNSAANDAQCIYGTDCITSMTFNIFDRWGNTVFASTDPKSCWDGSYNGKALDPAVFVYHLSATLANGDLVERQGNISLVR
jgi:gliding motility-associated-like protein